MLWSKLQVIRYPVFPRHSVKIWHTLMLTPQKLQSSGLDLCDKKVWVSRVFKSRSRDRILWSWCNGWSHRGGVMALMVLRIERPLLTQ